VWIRKHGQFLTDGFRKSIINSALIAPDDADRRIFGRLFSMLALSDKNEFQKLATSMPRGEAVRLMAPIVSGKLLFQETLLIFLRRCATPTRASGPDEDVRKRSLLLCLDTIRHIVKSGNITNLNFVRENFANIELMRPLWEDTDTNIRVSSYSICTLIAKEVCLRKSWSGTEKEIEAWLTDIIGYVGRPVFSRAATYLGGSLFLFPFVYQVLSNQPGDLPTEDAMSFRETCAILLDQRDDPDFDRETSRRPLFKVVELMQRSDYEVAREIVDKLRSIFPFLVASSPVAASPPNAASGPVTAFPLIAASEPPPIAASESPPIAASPLVAVPPHRADTLPHADTLSHIAPLRRAAAHPHATPTPHAPV